MLNVLLKVPRACLLCQSKSGLTVRSNYISGVIRYRYETLLLLFVGCVFDNNNIITIRVVEVRIWQDRKKRCFFSLLLCCVPYVYLSEVTPADTVTL